MKLRLLLLVCLLSAKVFGQYPNSTCFMVTAKNGLICRTGPSPDSLRIGKLPYGAIVHLWDKTTIASHVVEGSDTIHGFWWNIFIEDNVFYYTTIDPYKAKDYWTQTYVFSGFLEELERAKVFLNELSKKEFDGLKLQGYSGQKTHSKITDLDSIQTALKDRVSWTTKHGSDERTPDTLYLSNGTYQTMNQYFCCYRLEAFYPEEEVLFFKGGHESDISISLRTGETTETVGNPEFIRESPGGKMRLNGIDYGQGCLFYFLQEMNGNAPRYLCNFDSQHEMLEGMCWFEEFYWMNESAFVFSFLGASFNDEPETMKYYWGEIVR